MADNKRNTDPARVESADEDLREEPSQVSDEPESLDAGVAVPGEDPKPSGVEVGFEEPETEPEEEPEQLAELKDKLLRLAAEFDNFRKRVSRERLEQRRKAQADLVVLILDGLDDLGRVAHLDPQQTNVDDLQAGIELVERKLLKELAAGGLKRIGEVGETFDPNVHEAVSTQPAPSPDQDHTVSQVLKLGYQFDGVLLRPAVVEVFIAKDD